MTPDDLLIPDEATILHRDPPMIQTPDDLLTVGELAMILRRAPSTIQTSAHRYPHSLPPIVRIPGQRRLLWRRRDVTAWLAGLVQASPAPPSSLSSVAASGARRRGRPPKAAQVARARQFGERREQPSLDHPS
jgi:hypothetical protein